MSDDADKAPAPDVAAPEKSVTSKSKAKSGGAKSRGKKASMPVEEVNYEYGDIVLGRLRGYPPWPARIVDPNDLPANVLAQRPPKSNVIYCAQFFPVGDFSWLLPKDLSPLKPHQIEAFINEPHRKASGPLREAYRTAQDPTEWDQAQSAALRQLEEAEADEDVDELEEEEEEDDEGTSGKRKRSAPAQKKDSKRAKTTKKAASEPKSKAKAEKPKSDKPKVEKAPSANAAEDPNADPLASDPEAVKVKDWRHKLQRAFLVKGVPDASEMSTYDELFRNIENYPEMKLEYLQYSKIGKVLKKIAALDNIPRNDELQITSRATKLMNKWQNEIIQPSEAAEAAKSNGSEERPADAAPENTTTEEKAPEA